MKKIEIPESMRLASVWAVWAFLAFGALGWALFVVLRAFDAVKDAAAWVQAIGSIGAILAAALIASADRRFTNKNIRAKEAVVIRAVREHCLEALSAITSLNYGMVKHYRPVTASSPEAIQKSLKHVEDVLRDLGAIDLMLLPNIEVVECVVMARGTVKYCRAKALEGWDPTPALEVGEYSPLKIILDHMEKLVEQLGKKIESLRSDL